jgi:hypothetical protein
LRVCKECLVFFLIEADSEETKLDQYMKPLPKETVACAIANPPTEDMLRWRESGLKLISEGKVACILLAGGQV